MAGNFDHPEDIKSALRKRHGSVSAFARARELPLHSVRDVLRGRSVAQTAQAIANELGISTQDLSPDRFASHNRDSSAGVAAHRINGRGR